VLNLVLNFSDIESSLHVLLLFLMKKPITTRPDAVADGLPLSGQKDGSYF